MDPLAEVPVASRSLPGHDYTPMRKHLLDLDDLQVQELEGILDTTDAMKEVLARPIKRVPTLRGLTVVNLFYEASTRTRVSFELAAKSLSADVVNVASASSSAIKGESLVDTVRTLEALGADMIVMRHQHAGASGLAAQHFGGSVVNAGDGCHAHPTQALLDLYTMRKHFGRVRGLKVVIVGDILHSRVARSNIWGLSRLGAEVVLCGPPTLLPQDLQDGARGGACRHSALPVVKVMTSLDEAAVDADVIMALRLQRERQRGGLLPSLAEYTRLFSVTRDRLGLAHADALVMHPGPMNEGLEIAPDVAVCAQSVVQEQVANGVAVRMAVLYTLAGHHAGNGGLG